MTVATLLNRVSYAGNGVTTVFSFPNRFLADADIVVYQKVDATGVSTLKALTTHYTLTGAGGASGGNVTMLVAPPTGTTLIIYRDPVLTQPIDLVNGDPLDVETGVERAFDRSTLQIQRLRDLVDRSMRLNDSDTSGADPILPVPVASTLLGWNSAGTALQNNVAADVALTPISTFMATVVDDVDAATARATLGAVGLTGSETVAGIKTFTGANTHAGVETFSGGIAGVTSFTSGIGPGYIQNIGLTATVAAKALTIELKTKALADPSAASPVEIAFRNRTETVGDYVVRQITAASSIVVPNGATLGFTAAEAGSIYVYECDNGTIREIGLSKKALFDESRLHNTTAISATADSDNVLYTTTGMTSAAMRLTGRIEITTGAVAGEWDNEDTRITIWTPSVGHRSDYVTFNNASPGTTITAADTTIGASKELVVGAGDIVFCESVLLVTKGATAGRTRLQLVNSGTATVVGLSGATDDRYQPASVQYYFRHGWIMFVTVPGTLTFTLSSASTGSDATANSYSIGAFTIR